MICAHNVLKRFAPGLLLLAAVLGLLVAATEPAQAQTEKVLYSFTGGLDGAYPEITSLAMDKSGNLYGTTYQGGAYGYGTVFKLTPTGVETVLHNFAGGTNGAYPTGGLIFDAADNLYGATYMGGNALCGGPGCGTVFKLTLAGTLTVLYAFTGAPDGAYPSGELTFDGQGNLYGATWAGGILASACWSGGCGTVFELSPRGMETVLYSFTGAPDGDYPLGGVIFDKKGNLYGTTYYGGRTSCEFGCGTVFEITPTGEEIVLHAFGAVGDGVWPVAGLVWDAQGNLWGTTSAGGKFRGGVIFKVTLSGVETVAWSLNRHKNGCCPGAGLLWDAAGNLYGTTAYCGAYGGGTVFEMNNKGRFVVPHAFGLAGDGFGPEAGLISDTTGHLYGTTAVGGAYGNGTVYMLAP